jgi:hypothetical protein
MTILTATEQYETWLQKQIPLLRPDLKHKHEAMAAAAFPFLRATFYRWAETFPQVCPDLQTGPTVLGVGDLHVENFGTWRDIEGRLIWGVNDFDEACWLPYTCDLVRLATSAFLAIDAEHLKITRGLAVKAIAQGYNDGLQAGGRAFVLAEHHPTLRAMAIERLKVPRNYWDRLEAIPTLRSAPPAAAWKALQRMMPEKNLDCRIVHRIAGLGSLGRRRYLAIVNWHGGLIAREAKELAASAWDLVHRPRKKSELYYKEIMDRSVRCPDPFVRVKGGWIVRRLAPDCSRVELSSLPAKHDAKVLLHAMGWETANIHLGSQKPRKLLRDLAGRSQHWLHSAALAMADSVLQDWTEWRKRTHR